MTAVPPPVPPEIVRRAAVALAAVWPTDSKHVEDWHPDDAAAYDRGGRWREGMAEVRRVQQGRVAHEALAAVYGDIVEAARRDALAGMGRCDDRAPSLAPGVPSGFCVLEPGHGGWHETEDGMHWINEAPRTAPAATVSDQQPESAPAPVRGTDEAQKRSQPFLTNAFAVTPEMGRYLDETAPPSTPPSFTALDGTEEPTDD